VRETHADVVGEVGGNMWNAVAARRDSDKPPTSFAPPLLPPPPGHTGQINVSHVPS
jgi:hypothetical protein